MFVLKIGPVEVSPGLLLAPMEDISDLPFRMICKSMGADVVYTEFVNAEGLVRAAPRTRQKLEFCAAERPFGIQIYGASELSMEQATQIATAQEPDITQAEQPLVSMVKVSVGRLVRAAIEQAVLNRGPPEIDGQVER